VRPAFHQGIVLEKDLLVPKTFLQISCSFSLNRVIACWEARVASFTLKGVSKDLFNSCSKRSQLALLKLKHKSLRLSCVLSGPLKAIPRMIALWSDPVGCANRKYAQPSPGWTRSHQYLMCQRGRRRWNERLADSARLFSIIKSSTASPLSSVVCANHEVDNAFTSAVTIISLPLLFCFIFSMQVSSCARYSSTGCENWK